MRYLWALSCLLLESGAGSRGLQCAPGAAPTTQHWGRWLNLWVGKNFVGSRATGQCSLERLGHLPGTLGHLWTCHLPGCLSLQRWVSSIASSLVLQGQDLGHAT